jgi:hypothetical protein
MRYLGVACLLLASLSAAAAQMTHEETIVRTALCQALLCRPNPRRSE